MFFFPFLFSGYFFSADTRVVTIVSDGSDQSSSTLFYVVFELLFWCLQCWHVFFLLLFLTHIVFSTSSLGYKALCMVISFLVLWSICLSSSLIHFKNGLEYLTRGTAQVFTPFIRILINTFISNSFLALLEYSF